MSTERLKKVKLPASLDLVERAELGLNGLLGTVDPEVDFECYFREANQMVLSNRWSDREAHLRACKELKEQKVDIFNLVATCDVAEARAVRFAEVVSEEGALMGFLTRGDRDELRLLRVGEDWETVPLLQETQSHEPLARGRMMRSFVDAILRGASDGVWDATFFDGYRAQVVLSAIKQSVQEKRWVEVKPFTIFVLNTTSK